MNNWISVDERLPEVGEPVLTFETYVDIAELRYVKDGKPFFDNMNWMRGSDRITHWMPLPNQPA